MESIQQAQPADAAAVLELIKARIRWMDEQGIRQWNTTGYLEAYGLDYFMQAARQGVLYVFRPPQGSIQGAVILLEEDPRWSDGAPACYVHNLVTACGVPVPARLCWPCAAATPSALANNICGWIARRTTAN